MIKRFYKFLHQAKFPSRCFQAPPSPYPMTDPAQTNNRTLPFVRDWDRNHGHLDLHEHRVYADAGLVAPLPVQLLQKPAAMDHV